MVPLVDMHCHLLAGVDDGPRDMDEALEMCAAAYAEGVRLMAATAHQNERWPNVSPDVIRGGAVKLQEALARRGVKMTVFPCAEVMAQPETTQHWRRGKILSVADRGQYLLLEVPRGIFVDLLPTAYRLHAAGIRPILAHPEREAEYLHEAGRIEEMIDAGCLVQVSSRSVTDPKTKEDRNALRSWFQRGVVHFLGSDGHSPTRRPPCLASAWREITRWVGPGLADRIASSNGLAAAHGLPLRVRRPQVRSMATWWTSRLW